MKGEWCYWADYVSPTLCDNVIQNAKKLAANEPTIGSSSGKANEEYRRSVVRWVDVSINPEFTVVHDLMWKAMARINEDWFRFNVTSLPPMQFTEYDASYLGEYKSHQDVFWVTNTPNHRKLTLILQLSDPSEYQGGDLMLEYLSQDPSGGDYSMMKRKGSIIAFPSFIYHRLTPVTMGKRYSLVAWFEGPKFQ